MGPLLFLLYINDLQYAISLAQTRLFADDTPVLLKGKNLKDLKGKADDTLAELSKWFLLNKMSLSLNKSNFILFHGIRKDPCLDFNTLGNGTNSIHRVKSCKYVGLTIDETLSWNEHINNLCKSLTKFFSVFYNIRNIVDLNLARTIYYACIYSRIKYGIEIYGSASNNKLSKIQTLQNKLMKLITCKPPRYSTNQLHTDLKILQVRDIYEMSLLQFTFNCVNGNSIVNFSEFFQFQENVHGHNTRHKRQITRHRIKTEKGRTTTHYAGATLWNTLPTEITQSKTIKSFKRKLFAKYLSEYSVQQ